MEIEMDEELLFVDDEETESREGEEPSSGFWKVLIVDDEEEVHQVTKLALKSLVFDRRPVQFLSAYSAAEGKAILEEHEDIALILLDVVMEAENAGLQLVRYIRRNLGNSLVRIILRTGQPGQAPEYEVLTEYDINDYREKTELTAPKLYTTLITALRSYRDLMIIDTSRKGLQQIINGSLSVFQLQSLNRFAAGILGQIASLLGRSSSSHGMVVSYTGEASCVVAGIGAYQGMEGPLLALKDKTPKVYEVIYKAVEAREHLYQADGFALYFFSPQGPEIVLYMEQSPPLQEWERRLLEVFGANISIALENIFLNKEVEDTQKEIIFTLGEIAEARSLETGHHVKRVAEIAKLLALKSGFSQEEAELLGLASPIHDLGKLGIPDAILNKPGKLTPEEFEIMKQHTRIGYEMLKNSQRPILTTGALIALQHHERYDGKGYPQGLKGEAIHIYGRIVALADVFDALSSKRVYKASWPLVEVVDYIKEQRGTQFDPMLVDVFLTHLDEIVAIRERYRDWD